MSEKNLFDQIRIRKPKQVKTETPCEFPGCEAKGVFRAPKERGKNGEYFQYCLKHVKEYNQKYNYFEGMNEGAVRDYIKDSTIGHRPTWKLGQNTTTLSNTPRPTTRRSPFSKATANSASPRGRPSAMTTRAFDTLGLDPGSSKESVRTQFKVLVKRFHPDLNNGDRSQEGKLTPVLEAYNHLKAAGYA